MATRSFAYLSGSKDPKFRFSACNIEKLGMGLGMRLGLPSLGIY